MTTSIPIQQLMFSSQSSESVAARLPAPAGAARRFEQLIYAPDHRMTSGVGSLSGASGSMQYYVEQLSNRWQSGQSALARMTEAGQFTTKELVLTQVQMINCALDVEVSSKCASMFENGVQTLIQRS
jgi:hypothetical protein